MKRLKLISYSDAFFYSLMVGSGETLIVAFALAAGISENIAASIGVIPVGIASFFQLFSTAIIEKFKTYKKWVVTCALMQGVSLTFLGLAPLLTKNYLAESMFIISIFYWYFGLSAGPQWNAWLGILVPSSEQKKFFSHRNVVAQGAALLGLLGSGVALQYINGSDSSKVSIFIGLFILSAICRLISTYFLSNHPDCEIATVKAKLDPEIKTPQKKHYIPLGLMMTFVMSLSVYIAAPFFNPYMLKQLRLDYVKYTILVATVFVARMAHSYAMNNFLSRFGNQRSLFCGMALIVPLPIMWNFSNDYSYLLLLQVWSGFAWSSYELGMTLFLFETIESKSRSDLLTWFNMSSSAGIISGVCISWHLLQSTSMSESDYHDLFTLSSAMRLLPLIFVWPFSKAIVHQHFEFSVTNFRAGVRGMLRPLLIYADSSKNKERPKGDKN